MDNLDQLVASATADFAAATEPAKLEDAKARYLGKEGSLTALLKGLGKLPPDERKTAGAAINVAKECIESALATRREALKNAQLEAQLATEALDVTLPGRGLPRGGLHPVTITPCALQPEIRCPSVTSRRLPTLVMIFILYIPLWSELLWGQQCHP